MLSSAAPQNVAELKTALAQRDALIAALRGTVEALQAQIAVLEGILVNHANENEILKRRLFGAKSERGGTSELQLKLGDLLEQQAKLQQQLDALSGKGQDEPSSTPPAEPPASPPTKPRPKPKGRRDLSESKLPRTFVDIRDAELEKTGKFIGWDESFQLMHTRASFRVLVKRTAKYEIQVERETTVLGTPLPQQLFPRGLLHTSTLAWLAVQKFALGVPHYRLEQLLTAQGEPLDRGTMCRNMEEVGNTLGATIVQAMMRDALENCCVLSTDATGAAIQPEKSKGKGKAKGEGEVRLKQACKRGHFFTIVADCDHVLFTFTEHHSHDAVAAMFKGFRGFLQKDGSSVYSILERGPPSAADEKVTLVGCWAHARRYFFEAAICKYWVGVEGLTRIRAIYRADNELAGLPPIERKRERQEKVLPLIEEFFAWVHKAARETLGRTLATKALGYAKNQEQELRNVLLDGRLPLDNTRSERALRTIVVGRKNWLFYGSDVHAEAAAALFSLIASCRLHRIDPEQYLDEVMRVLPYWPKKRYLELAPKYWAATRARLDPSELAAPIAEITIPPVQTIAHS
jgi:transposase